jgi:hypothetical protein
MAVLLRWLPWHDGYVSADFSAQAISTGLSLRGVQSSDQPVLLTNLIAGNQLLQSGQIWTTKDSRCRDRLLDTTMKHEFVRMHDSTLALWAPTSRTGSRQLCQ